MFKIPENMNNGEVVNIAGKTYQHLDGKLKIVNNPDSSIDLSEVLSNYATKDELGGVGSVEGGMHPDKFAMVVDGQIDLSLANFFIAEFSSNYVFNISNINKAKDTVSFFYLQVKATGNPAVTWFGDIRWGSETTPVLSNGKSDVFLFYTYNGGKTWIGNPVNKDVDTYVAPELAIGLGTMTQQPTLKNTSGYAINFLCMSVIDDVLYLGSELNTIYKSTDGVVWTRLYKFSGLSSTTNSARVWNMVKINNRYFMTCDEGYICYSDNMTSWNVTDVGATTITRLYYLGGKYISMDGTGSSIYTSVDGVTWKKETNLPSSGGFKDMSYIADKWIGIYNKDIYYSSNLSTWTKITATEELGTEGDRLLLVDDKLIFAGTGSGVYTTDGVNWMPVDFTFTLPYLIKSRRYYKIDGLYICLFSNGMVAMSKDGYEWTEVDNNLNNVAAGTTGQFRDICLFKNKWFLLNSNTGVMVGDTIFE